jgi:glutathione synthase/RimK-type ligase-like ATP-grasp enzyme
MKNKELIILTGRNKFFGQTRKPWTSLDMDAIEAILQRNGFDVKVFDFSDVANHKVQLKNETIFYAFSQRENYRNYIQDIVYQLSKNNRVIPSFDLLKCHENKGFQELYKQEIGLHSLRGFYYTSIGEVDREKIVFPVVLKTVQGTNGEGVYLLRNSKDFEKVAGQLVENIGIFTQLDLLRRKYLRKKKFADYPGFSDRKDYEEYKEYIKVETNFILQEYVPDLDFDFRVLVANDRYYVMKRGVKKGDFRASGSKKFSFNKEPDSKLLEFSREIYQKFDTPFLSIDVLCNEKDYFLGEFQALHFGMSAISKSNGWFGLSEQNDWVFHEEKPEIEKVFAHTLISYLQKLP